jgi:hypothetical protein
MATVRIQLRAVNPGGTPLLVGVLGTVLCAVVAFYLALWLAGGGLKQWVIAGALAFVPFLLVLYPHPKHLLLFGWVLTLTYNRQYFSFEGIFGKQGSQGPYWIVSDIFLLGLLLMVIYEKAYQHASAEPRGRRFWPWYLPFVLASLLSIVGSARPEWGVFELFRMAKFGFIIWYASRHIGRREWWVCVAAMAVAMSFQSAVGLKEIVTGRSGVIGIEQAPTGPGKFTQAFTQENFYGSVRATGTMDHPPNLACYMLQVLPIPLALLLGARHRELRWMGLIVFGMGTVGLACTLSRWPWALAMGQALLIAAATVWTFRMSLKRMAGILVLSTVLAGIAMFPLRAKIMKRLTGDFSASVDQRTESSRVALRMIRDFPLTGVGLNNSAHYLVKYFPQIRWAIDNDEFLVSKVNARALAVVGNGFFYVPVETGVLGAFAFVFYLMGVAVVCIRALRNTQGDVQLVCIGMAFGLLGVIGQQVVDFSYWVDPLLYTFGLVVGLLNVAPGLFKSQSPANEENLYEMVT